MRKNMYSQDVISMFNFVVFNSFNSAVIKKAQKCSATFSNSSSKAMLDPSLLWWSIGT